MCRRFDRESLSLPEILSTRRLRLRPLEPGDIKCLWQMDSDPEVMRFVDRPATCMDTHRNTIVEAIDQGQRFRFLRMIEQSDQLEDPLGWVFLRPTEDHRWLELGYRLLPRAWGRGMVPEASKALINHAVTAWNADRIMALIDPGNDKSRRVAGKLGMTMNSLTRDYYDQELELWVLDAAQEQYSLTSP